LPLAIEPAAGVPATRAPGSAKSYSLGLSQKYPQPQKDMHEVFEMASSLVWFYNCFIHFTFTAAVVRNRLSPLYFPRVKLAQYIL
jgi:hypothetical protein